MKKSVLALVLAIPVVAYPVASWVVGGQAVAILDRQYAQQSNNQFVHLVERQTRRGIFSSEDVATFELTPEFMEPFRQAMQQDVALPPAEARRFVVRSHIQHGPLPGFSGIGLAKVHSELELNDPLVTKLYAGKSPLTVDTQLDFSGAGHEQMRSPAVEGVVDGVQQFAWGELALNIDFNHDASVWTIQGGWPFIKMRSMEEPVQFEIKGLTLEGQQTRVSSGQPDLYTGPLKLTLQSMDTQSTDQSRPPMHMENLRVQSNVTESAGFIDITAGYAVDTLRVGEQVFKAAHFDLALRHLQAAALAELNALSQQMNSSSELDMAQLKPLLRPTQVLLENSPEFAIERMGVMTPEGEVKASAFVRLPNAKLGNLEQAVENPLILMALASVIEAQVHIDVPAALVTANLDVNQTEQLTALIQAGYVLNKNNQLSTMFSYAQGNMTINGQSLDPGMMMGVGQE